MRPGFYFMPERGDVDSETTPVLYFLSVDHFITTPLQGGTMIPLAGNPTPLPPKEEAVIGALKREIGAEKLFLPPEYRKFCDVRDNPLLPSSVRYAARDNAVKMLHAAIGWE